MRELTFQEMNDVSGSGDIQNQITETFITFGERTGKMIGGSLSVALFGALGTAIPVVGNLLGGVVGKFVGEFIGGNVGSEAGNVLGYNFGAFVEGLFSGVSRFLDTKNLTN